MVQPFFSVKMSLAFNSPSFVRHELARDKEFYLWTLGASSKLDS